MVGGPVMKNSRRHERFKSDFLEINSQLAFAAKVTILDISVGGISLKADRRLNIGCKYVIKLEDKQKVFALKGEVAWSALSGTTKTPDGESMPLYTAGMKFIDLSEEKIVELQNFVESHKKEVLPAGDRRTNVRFRIGEPENVLLNYQTDYKVKVISLSGMLIETTQALQSENRISMELSIHDDNRISFLGRVVTCKTTQEAGKEHYDIGIEFIDLTDKDKDVLTSFVAYVAASKIE
jgi:Tfp pilus assembly protein PilZ